VVILNKDSNNETNNGSSNVLLALEVVFLSVMILILGVYTFTSFNSFSDKLDDNMYSLNNDLNNGFNSDLSVINKYSLEGLDISIGKEGYDSVFKFCRNPSTGTSEEVIWDLGDDYTFLNSSEPLRIVSTSVDDVYGGDGSWNIAVYGLDNDYNEIFEIVTLNGTTPVYTQNSYVRTYRSHVINSGLATAIENANLGDITLTANDSNIAQAAILTHNGQTLMCVYTVPNDKTAFVTGISVNVGQGKQAFMKAKARNCDNSSICSFSTKYSIDLYQDTFFGELRVPLRLEEKTDVVFTSELSSTPEVTTSGSFGLILIDNELLPELEQ